MTTAKDDTEYQQLKIEPDAWINGHYALAAICWGGIFMLLISLGVSP